MSKVEFTLKTKTMATSNQGMLGAFTGSVGPVTGYVRYGSNILRSSTSTVKDKTTPLRAIQRDKMKICLDFIRAFSGTGFFKKSFPAHGHKGSGYNRAISALMSRAITGAYPDLSLNYGQMLISKGMLPGVEKAKAVLKPKSIIQFSFADNSMDGIASAEDTVILVAYAPELQQAIFNLYSGFRKDGKASLDVSPFKGNAVETWIGFLSKDEADASDSAWTGRMEV
jgi:hypothetical protein